MPTASEIMTGLRIGGEIAAWLIELIGRFIDGDESQEVQRVMDVLPDRLRADVEHERQRAAMRRELASHLEADAESEWPG